MEKICIELKNCFGIEYLHHNFDFKKSNTNIVYAKNGSMKTSFSKVFEHIQNGDIQNIKEEIFGNKHEYKILIDGIDILSKDIYTIKGIDLEMKVNSDLLVNSKLKKEYDGLNNKITKALKGLFSELSKKNGLKRDDNIKKLLEDFGFKGGNIFDFLIENQKSFKENSFDKLKYNDIFGDDKVLTLLKNPGFKDNIEKYYKKYNEIIEKIPFFEKGKFTLDNLYQLKNKIKDEKLYEVKKNGIYLSDRKINSFEELEVEINEIMKEINDDEKLKFFREKIEKGTKSVKIFDNLVKEYGDNLILKLKDIVSFKKELWLGYLFLLKDNIEELIELHTNSKDRIKEIQEESKNEIKKWEEIISEFKNKFHLPFYDIVIENIENVILGGEEPQIIFIHKKGENEVKLYKKDFLGKNTLSGGERRVLFLLYILFDIKTFEKNKEKKLFIIDDIADSFDYKNKYAIVEYLKEISENDNFKSILLTHNFDFFRTLQNRILDTNKWTNSFITNKYNGNIELKLAGSKNIINPFSEWKNNLNNDFKSLIPAIPFIRNLIEFKEGNKTKEYLTLTYCLHQKEDEKLDTDNNILSKKTEDILISDIEPIFKDVLKNVNFTYSNEDKNKKIIDVFFGEAENILKDENIDSISIGNKIILSIVCRLKVEKFILSKISDLTPINGAQTGKLFQRYKDEFGNSSEQNNIIKIIQSVNIMTPENIHLNSFMYEPILDMDILELKDLYDRVKLLK